MAAKKIQSRRKHKIMRTLEELDAFADRVTMHVRLMRMSHLQCSKCNDRSTLGTWSFIYDFYRNESGDITQANTEDCELRCPACGNTELVHWHHVGERIIDAIETHGIVPEELFKTVYKRNEEGALLKIYPP